MSREENIFWQVYRDISEAITTIFRFSDVTILKYCLLSNTNIMSLLLRPKHHLFLKWWFYEKWFYNSFYGSRFVENTNYRIDVKP